MKKLIIIVLICTILVITVLTGCQGTSNAFGQVDTIKGNDVSIFVLTPPFGLFNIVNDQPISQGPYGIGGMTPTGQEVTYPVPSNTPVNIWGISQNTQSSFSEIEPGDYIYITFSGSKPTAVTVVEMYGPESNGSEDSPAPSAS